MPYLIKPPLRIHIRNPYNSYIMLYNHYLFLPQKGRYANLLLVYHIYTFLLFLFLLFLLLLLMLKRRFHEHQPKRECEPKRNSRSDVALLTVFLALHNFICLQFIFHHGDKLIFLW